MKKEVNLVEIKKELNAQIGDKETFNALMNNTFKGLAPATAKEAILEGMIRGYEFKDFLEKNVYAIPYSNQYSLVSSIDYARKIGMRSGVVGKSAPEFKEKEEKIISCTVCIKRKVDGYVGEYCATVFFDEYTTGRNLWKTKPRTMLAKVAEMHALRMACPEEMSQVYVEEERQAEIISTQTIDAEIDVKEHEDKLRATKTLDELKKTWADLPKPVKDKLEGVKDEMKAKLTPDKPAKKPKAEEKVVIDLDK